MSDLQAVKNVETVVSKIYQISGWNTGSQLAIVAQFIQEKGWQYWQSYPNVSEFNFGNVGDINGQVLPQISSELSGIAVYLYVLLVSNPNAYQQVVQELKDGNAQGAVEALSQSPWANPPYGQDIIDTFDTVKNLLSVPVSQPIDTHTPVSHVPSYTVIAGDNLWTIAQSHGLTIHQLLQWNSQIKNPNLIYPGEVIKLAGE